MSGNTLCWTAFLAPDVRVVPHAHGMRLQTATQHVALSPAEAREVAATLMAPSAQDAAARDSGVARDRLDRLGLLAHRLQGDGPILTCLPLRAPPGPPPKAAIQGHLRLSSHAILRPFEGHFSLERPGGWARLTLHDPALMNVMTRLAEGTSVQDCIQEIPDRSADWISAVLHGLHWCSMLDSAPGSNWTLPDLMLHTATRLGYARKHLGKSEPRESAPEPQPRPRLARHMLDRPDPADLARSDPPFAVVAARRRAQRNHGPGCLKEAQLSEFLYRTLHETDGHRPYPSGGACYPVTGYLALHRSADVPAGLYRYDALAHCLDKVAESGAGLNRLLEDAAASAGVSETPQALLILSARFSISRSVYNDLSYSLILKEVGAIMQMAMLAAAATDLAACPLGTGNAPAFSALAGVDPMIETSVGEVMLGALGTDTGT